MQARLFEKKKASIIYSYSDNNDTVRAPGGRCKGRSWMMMMGPVSLECTRTTEAVACSSNDRTVREQEEEESIATRLTGKCAIAALGLALRSERE